MDKISLMTFASSNWVKSKDRFNRDVEMIQEKFNYFYKAFNWTEKDMGKDYHDRFSRYFSDHGFGYWSWKPYALIQALDKIEDGDFLLYLDGDCFLPVDRMELFIEKLQQVKDVIKNNSAKIGLTTYIDVNGYKISNNAIVKRQILEKFELVDNREFLFEYPHFQSGLIMLQKNEWTSSLMEEWYEFYLNNYENVIRGGYTDKTGQNDGYLHNGGDQAILQCMLFKRRPPVASMNFMYDFKVITNNWG